MALRDDFMQDWAAAGDSLNKRGATLTRGFDTLERHGVEVTMRRNLLVGAQVDRWRAQFDAARWIGQGLAELDSSA